MGSRPLIPINSSKAIEKDIILQFAIKSASALHLIPLDLNTRQYPAKCLVSPAMYSSEKSNNWRKKKKKPIPLRNLTHNMSAGVFLK